MYHLFQSMNQGGVKWNHVALLRIFNNPSQDSLAIAIGHVWQVLTPTISVSKASDPTYLKFYL